MRRIVKTVRNTTGQITSQEVIKPKQLSAFIPMTPANGTDKADLRKKLLIIHSDVRYSGKERGFYVN